MKIRTTPASIKIYRKCKMTKTTRFKNYLGKMKSFFEDVLMLKSEFTLALFCDTSFMNFSREVGVVGLLINKEKRFLIDLLFYRSNF